MSGNNTIQLVLEVDDKGSAKVKTFSSTLANETKRISENVTQSAGAVGKVEAACGSLSGVVKTLAAGFAAWKLVEFVKDSAMLSARVETLGIVMEQVGRNALYSKAEVASYAEGVKKMGITTEESRQTVISMIQAHLDLSKASQLARVAQDAAVIGNMNSSEALQTLLHGITTLQPEILRTVGIIVNFEQEYVKFAAATGRTVESLSGQEKQQIALNAVLEAGTRIAGSYTAAMGTAGKQITSMPRYVAELKEALGDVFAPATNDAVTKMTESIKEFEERIKSPAGQQAVASLVNTIVTLIDIAAKDLPTALSAGLLAVEVFASGFVVAYAVIAAYGKVLGTVAAAMVQFTTGNFRAAWETIKGGASDVGGVFVEMSAKINALWGDTVAGAQKSTKAATNAVNEADEKFNEGLRAAAEKQNALDGEQQRKHDEAIKRQATQDQEALKKWEAMKETIGLVGEQKELAQLQRQYGAYQRVVEDKAALERWYSLAKADITRTAAMKVAEEDKKTLESRLQTYQKFYDSVTQQIQQNAELEKKHVLELNAIYQEKLDLQRSSAEMIAKLQGLVAPAMSAKETYETQKTGLTEQYMAAMNLSGRDQVKALEDYKQALASFAQTWQKGVSETTETLFHGPQTETIISGESIVKSAMSDIAQAIQAQQRALSDLAEEKQKQIGADKAWGASLAQTAQEAAGEIQKIQGVIGELSAQIEAMQKTITITGQDDVSWRVGIIAQQLAALHDKTITITTVHQEIYESGSAITASSAPGAAANVESSSSVPQYDVEGYPQAFGGSSGWESQSGWESHALGTGYIPKTGLYMLHKGEAVTPAPEVVRGNKGGSVQFGDIHIHIPESAAPQRPEDWRAITRQYIVPELEKIGRA